MSFEDDQYVEFDYDDDMFYITANSGAIRGYHISDEPDLVSNILDSRDSGEIDVYTLEMEQTDDMGQQDFDRLSEEIKNEYGEKFGYDFDDWSW